MRYQTVLKRAKKHMTWLLLVAILLLVVLLQLFYPSNRALPFASMSGKNVGWQNYDDLYVQLTNQFQDTKLVLASSVKKETYQLSEAGAEIYPDKFVKQTQNYSVWQRLIPFSILWQTPKVDDLSVGYTEEILQKFTGDQVKKFIIAPSNARLTIKNGELDAVNDKSGVTVDPVKLSTVIKDFAVSVGAVNEIKVPEEVVRAKTTSADFADVKSSAETALSREVMIIAHDKEFKPAKKQVASWLSIGEDEQKKPKLVFDTKRFNGYIGTIDKQVAVAPGVTTVTVVDGVEVSRKTGKAGNSINKPALEKLVQDWVLSGIGGPSFTAEFTTIKPSVTFHRSYSHTEKGLNTFLRDKAKVMDVSVAIQQIGGNGWRAGVNESKSMPSASTYKLFVAKWLFDQIDQKKIKWSDKILDTNVAECFDRMTIASTNPCAVAWLDKAGRSNMNNYVYGLGFSQGTSFTNQIAVHSTPNDLLKMMIGIDNGSIIGGKNRDKLIKNLSSHPFRDGIPSGTAGSVYDKVGFLWDYVHDIAIINHPKGKYAMVIMTKGQSYAAIAQLTREIEGIMYP